MSEGQRKRVQLYLNLIKPFKICLLDEITVNLDLLVKDKFMNYLKIETSRRNCCIVYVTHIFDGLEEWGTKLIYMKNSNDISITNVNTIPSIYKFLLTSFKQDFVNTVESEGTLIDINLKNAGGYSHGVIGTNN